MIKFYYGPYASYSQTTHADGIYFATDKKVIRLNGVDYIGNINADGTNFVKSVTKNSEGKLNVTLGNGTTTVLTAVTLVNNLTTTSAGQGALDAYQGKLLLDKINNLGNVYQVKGTVSNKTALLALTSASVGYVYNMTNACTLNGKDYSAGTNFVCITAFTSASSNTESCWDALGGTMTGYATEDYVTNTLEDYLTIATAVKYLEKTKAAIMTEGDAETFIRVGTSGAYTQHTTAITSSSYDMCWKIITCTPINIDGGEAQYCWFRIGFAPESGSSIPYSRLRVQQARITGDWSYPKESDWIDVSYFNGINLGQIATNTSNISSLNTKVNTLNANSSTSGSVDYKIAQALSWNVVS